jgi:uncharacterized protein (DUF1800 family)
MGYQGFWIRSLVLAGVFLSSHAWAQPTPAPIVTLTTSKSEIAAGKTARISWTSTNATRCVGSGAWAQVYEGNAAKRGSFTTAALTERTNLFSLNCSGPSGSTQQSLTITALPKPDVTLTAQPNRALPGESVVLSWQSADATSCVASGAPFVGNKSISGSETLDDLTKGTKKFSISCKGVGGTTKVTTEVAVVPVPTLTFSASATQVAEKSSTQLKWRATDATSCIASGDWSGEQKTSGTVSTGNITDSKRYTLTCTGLNGVAQKTVDVVALPAPRVTLSISDSLVATGSSVDIRWSSEFATECRASGSPFTGVKSLDGEEVLAKLTSGEKRFKLTCKGPGGSAFAEATLSVTAKPTIAKFAMDKAVVALGTNAVLSWEVLNTSRCHASGGWSGARDVSGSISFKATTSGQFTFSIECQGAREVVKKTITVAVPHVPQPTSYENKNSVPFDQTQIPFLGVLNVPREEKEWDLTGQSITIGDFFQEGRFSAFVSTARATGRFGIPNVSDVPGKAYFLSQDDSGQWRDRTTELLSSPEDRETCTTINQALTADFNNDRKPDIFLACAGRANYQQLPTGESEITHPNYADIHLAKPVLYLSSASGRYKRVELPYRWYVQHASAADLNGDGNVDIAIAYNSQFPKEEDRTPFVLLGKGDGSFTRADGLLPLMNNNGRPTAWEIGGYMGLHLIPIGNRLDLLMVGYQSIAWIRGVEKQPGRFDVKTRRLIKMPTSPKTGERYNSPPDIVLAHDSFYFVSQACFEGGCDWDLIRSDLKSLTPVIVPVLSNLNNNYRTVTSQVKTALDGSIVAYHAGCWPPNPGMCAMQVRAGIGQTLANLETLRYIASHRDLIESIGVDIAKGRAHYEQHALSQSRTITFDPLIYVASNPDLIPLIGADREKAARHYITTGYREGRPTSGFDPLRYIASHGDLIESFGLDTTAATENYLRFGYREGREVTFDPLAYIASFADLIKRFGIDALAAIEHFILEGFEEGRRVTFDALAYLASYADLIGQFGLDTAAAAKHYIETGFNEGRKVLFDALGYLANNADVRSQFGSDVIAATRYYITKGFSENPPFARHSDSPTTWFEAHRFLVQTSFGPTEQTIEQLLEFGNGPNGYERWIDAQIAKPVSANLPTLIARTPVDRKNMGASQLIADRVDIWFRNAMTGDDQLRQRVGWALAQIMVVSDNGALMELPYAVADFQDMLNRNAFGNFRSLLEDVTLHPAMGLYLSMYGNQKAVEGTNLRPDENYAREMMQLFTIGLVELNIDGTVKRDANGQPIPTYTQDTIRGLARVFTGWKAQCFDYVPRDQCFQGAYLVPWPNENGFNQGKPMVVHEDFHEPGAKQLLVYRGVSLAGGVLPANQGGRRDLQLALDNVFHHPNVGPFISKQLIQKLVTSNPSPDYVRRVAEVFNDDGSGVRGNLKAVIKAILLDREARELTNRSTAGKIKEPLLRLTQLWRMYAEEIPAGKFIYGIPGGPVFTLGQSPGQSPSVFNFFSPFYAPPGEIAQEGLVAPELQLANENLHTQLGGVFFNQSHYQTSRSQWTRGDSTFIDVEEEMRAAGDVDRLMDLVAKKLLGSAEAMSPALREETRRQLRRWKADQTYVDNQYGTREEHFEYFQRNRVGDALYLILTSPEFAVQQ